jgi:vitamin B12 transporter
MKRTTLSLIAASLLLGNSAFAEEDLGEITVTTATQTSQKLQEVTSNTDVITAQEIEERGYTTVAQALGSVAGISFVSNGGIGQPTSVFLRGMDSKHTLVLIDGVRYNDPTSLSGAPFADLMVDDIAQIEIVKGAQSGIWGADASAGVINIITQKAQKGTHASAHVEGGSFGTWKYGATVSSAAESYYAKLSYNVVDTDGFTTVAPYGEDIDNFEDDEYKNETLNIQAGYHFNKNNTLELSYTQIDGKGDADPYDMSTYSFNPNGEYRLESTYKFMKANFNHVDSFNKLNIYAQRSDFSRTYPDASFGQHFDGTVDEYGINSRIGYREKDFVLVGIDHKNYEYQNNMNREYDSTGIFATNTNTFEGILGGTTILTESLRFDNYSDFDNKTTGKIGVKHIHAHIEGLTTSFNYGTAYNVPTIYNLYDPFSGNTGLEPETVDSFDITIDYKGFKATYFSNRIDDMIDYVSKYDADGNWIGGGFENVSGTSRIDGLELAYAHEVYEGVVLNTNYTHLFKAEDNDGKALGRRAKDTFNIALDYYGIENLHLGVDAQYIGERYDRAGEQGEQTGKYTVFNMTADYQITDNIQVYGKIENLGDKYYQSVYGYATSPRAFYIGVRGKI